MDTATALDVKARHEAMLLALPGVAGVGVGTRAGRPVIAVFVGPVVAPVGVPEELEGVPVVVVDLGDISPL